MDEQLVKKYTLPIVGTMVTSAITYMMAADDDATYKGENSVESSKQQAASDARDQFMTKMDEILQEIIDSKKEIEPVTYVPAGTRVIIYPMTDLWLRTTKDIEKGVMSYNPVGTENVLVTSDGNPSNATTTTTVGNTQQKVIMGNQNNNNQQQNDNMPLVVPEEQTQNQQRRQQVRALPPPSADGSAISVPEEDEEDSDGEIDLF